MTEDFKNGEMGPQLPRPSRYSESKRPTLVRTDPITNLDFYELQEPIYKQRVIANLLSGVLPVARAVTIPVPSADAEYPKVERRAHSVGTEEFSAREEMTADTLARAWAVCVVVGMLCDDMDHILGANRTSDPNIFSAGFRWNVGKDDGVPAVFDFGLASDPTRERLMQFTLRQQLKLLLRMAQGFVDGWDQELENKVLLETKKMFATLLEHYSGETGKERFNTAYQNVPRRMWDISPLLLGMRRRRFISNIAKCNAVMQKATADKPTT